MALAVDELAVVSGCFILFEFEVGRRGELADVD